MTVNIGLRYEIFPPFYEVNDQYSNFNMEMLKVELAGKNTSRTLGVKTD